MYYKDYKIINKWWKSMLAIEVSGKEILFNNMEELKRYVDNLYK